MKAYEAGAAAVAVLESENNKRTREAETRDCLRCPDESPVKQLAISHLP